MKSVYLLSFVLLISCTYDVEKQVCGEEVEGNYMVNNLYEYWTLKDSCIKTKNFLCEGTYFLDVESIKPRYCTWTIYSLLDSMCSSDIPKIEFDVKLNKSDTSLLIYGVYSDDFVLNPGHKLLFLSTNDGVNYHGNAELNFHNVTIYSKNIYTTTNVHYISKGGFSEDSAYFFPIMKSMSCTIKAHKPE